MNRRRRRGYDQVGDGCAMIAGLTVMGTMLIAAFRLVLWLFGIIECLGC